MHTRYIYLLLQSNYFYLVPLLILVHTLLYIFSTYALAPSTFTTFTYFSTFTPTYAHFYYSN
jgi:hypothetical protein